MQEQEVKIEMERALTIRNILDKKYKLFPFKGEWFDAFKRPETRGVWFIWGNSGNGKTTFVWQLVKYLSQFDKVLVNSLEEGHSHTVKESFERTGMMDVDGRVLVVSEPNKKFVQRLERRKSLDIVVIDSFQHFQMNYKEYLAFKKKFQKKLIIFISQADGKYPAGRPARSVMYDATLKIWVEGYRAFSKGRYIGPIGYYNIWEEKAISYWGN